MVARLDRITRSLLAWAELVERSRRRGRAIVAVAEGFDLSTDSGEMAAGVLAVVAQYERRLIGARTREAMAAATVVLATPPLPLATATACWLGAGDLLQLVCRRGISSLRS